MPSETMCTPGQGWHDWNVWEHPHPTTSQDCSELRPIPEEGQHDSCSSSLQRCYVAWGVWGDSHPTSWQDCSELRPIPQEGHQDSCSASGQTWYEDWSMCEDSHASTASQPADEGLIGEVARRGLLPSLPWLQAEPGATCLVELGRGGYGVVHLVDYGGELLVRKRFYDARLMDDEAYALWLLQGAGGTPLLRSALKEPPTLYMTYCGCDTLEAFFHSGPEARQMLQVMLDLAQQVAQIHAKGVVHLDLKADNVMVQGTHARIIDVGLAALPGQRLPFKNVDLRRVNWMCPQAALRGPVTYEADVYSLGRLLQRAQHMLAGQPVSRQLAVLASHALAEHPSHRPALPFLIAALRTLTH